MASTRVITATDPVTGQAFSRRTARTYVAVVITGTDGQAWPHTWCGRPDLAAKALARYRKACPDARLAPVTADPWAAAEPEPVAVPEPVASLAGLAADMGRSLGLAAGGRLAPPEPVAADAARSGRLLSQLRAQAADRLADADRLERFVAGGWFDDVATARVMAAEAQAARRHAAALTAWADQLTV